MRTLLRSPSTYPFSVAVDPTGTCIRGEARFKKLLERVKYEREHFEE